MAKKAAVRKPHASEVRRGRRTAEQLREGVSEIRRVAGDLDVELRKMEAQGISEITVDGITKLDRGIALIREFNTRVRLGLVVAESEAEGR